MRGDKFGCCLQRACWPAHSNSAILQMLSLFASIVWVMRLKLKLSSLLGLVTAAADGQLQLLWLTLQQ